MQALFEQEEGKKRTDFKVCALYVRFENEEKCRENISPSCLV